MRRIVATVLVTLLALVVVPNAWAQQKFPPVEQLKSHPGLPDPLVFFASGERVATPEQWTQRRVELKELFQHYMYGYLPAVPKITARVVRRDDAYFGGQAIKKEVTIQFGPATAPPINLLLVIPKQRKGPAPVFVGMNFCGNHTLVDDPSVALPTVWMPDRCPSCQGNVAHEEGRGKQKDIWNLEYVISRGYAVATFYSGDIDPDKPDWSDGVHPHFVSAGQSTPSATSWGTVAAWAWGIHRAVDYLVTDADLDPKKIAVVGHSRLGKTALLAGAFDERIALAIPHQAGCGGTAPSRSQVGESVKAINDRFPHWFDDVFPQFNDQVERLPFDQHCLAALMAPRPLLYSNATEDTWANPDGQFEMLRGAEAVYKLLGAEGLASPQIPEIGKLSAGRLGYFIRAGKHSMNREDWQAFIDFADTHLGKPK